MGNLEVQQKSNNVGKKNAENALFGIIKEELAGLKNNVEAKKEKPIELICAEDNCTLSGTNGSDLYTTLLPTTIEKGYEFTNDAKFKEFVASSLNNLKGNTLISIFINSDKSIEIYTKESIQPTKKSYIESKVETDQDHLAPSIVTSAKVDISGGNISGEKPNITEPVQFREVAPSGIVTSNTGESSSSEVEENTTETTIDVSGLIPLKDSNGVKIANDIINRAKEKNPNLSYLDNLGKDLGKELDEFKKNKPNSTIEIYSAGFYESGSFSIRVRQKGTANFGKLYGSSTAKEGVKLLRDTKAKK